MHILKIIRCGTLEKYVFISYASISHSMDEKGNNSDSEIVCLVINT